MIISGDGDYAQTCRGQNAWALGPETGVKPMLLEEQTEEEQTEQTGDMYLRYVSPFFSPQKPKFDLDLSAGGAGGCRLAPRG